MAGFWPIAAVVQGSLASLDFVHHVITSFGLGFPPLLRFSTSKMGAIAAQGGMDSEGKASDSWGLPHIL